MMILKEGDRKMDMSFYCKERGYHIFDEKSYDEISANCSICNGQIITPTRIDQFMPMVIPYRTEQGSLQVLKKPANAIVAGITLVIVLSVISVFNLNLRSAYGAVGSSNVKKTTPPLQSKPIIKKKDSPAIAGAKAKLELSTQKSDLDAMFLALKELQALGNNSPKISEQLTRVQTAIPLLQKIRLFQSEHNHEEVVKAAGKFLEYFPDHPEARRALKESGLIFAYLQEGLNSLSSCFEQDNLDKTQLVQKKTNEGKDENDFSRIFFQLSKAEKLVTEAKKLDPQFERALEVDRVISDTKNTIGYLVSYSLITMDGVIATGYAGLFDAVYSLMQASLDLKYSSPSDAWKKAAPLLTKLEMDQKELFDRMDDLS